MQWHNNLMLAILTFENLKYFKVIFMSLSQARNYSWYQALTLTLEITILPYLSTLMKTQWHFQNIQLIRILTCLLILSSLIDLMCHQSFQMNQIYSICRWLSSIYCLLKEFKIRLTLPYPRGPWQTFFKNSVTPQDIKMKFSSLILHLHGSFCKWWKF